MKTFVFHPPGPVVVRARIEGPTLQKAQNALAAMVGLMMECDGGEAISLICYDSPILSLFIPLPLIRDDSHWSEEN